MNGKKSKRGWLYIDIAFLVCLLLIGGCCGGCISDKGFHYSEGHRDGYIQKFSKKGLFFKTWEGEMALPGFRNVGAGDNQTVSNVFAFTVDDEKLIEEINNLTANDFVRIYYDQRVLGSPLHGETGYFVTKVEKLEKR